MIYVRDLAAGEHQELKTMSLKETGRVSQRAQMILMSSKNLIVPEIAALLEVSPATVRFWIRKFEAEGPAGLHDANRSGRPRNNKRRDEASESYPLKGLLLNPVRKRKRQ